jgi:hypothetical protein
MCEWVNSTVRFNLRWACRQHTLYFSRSSLLRGALMMLRRMLEGALKCALRDLRLEDEMSIDGLLIIKLTEWQI